MILIVLFMVSMHGGIIQAAVPSFGSCPKAPGITNFEKARYLGSWYEYSNVFEFYQIGGTCVRATYTEEGDRIGVFNEGVNTITGRYGNVKGAARPASKYRAEFIVGFEGIPFSNGDGGSEANYKVVDTDYDSYAIVYDCSPFPLIKKESLWLLTRKQNPDPKLVKWAYSRMRSLGLPVGSLQKTTQTNCSLLPPPGQAKPAVTIESLG
eukprot:TRINITY_DN13993_c0_g1_i1.p1 TRINITY_DN13993_c0_g1~~TRINITY_DN13993_c0_g1_i1.p1  ORF type:complete len:209 (-),score=39.58 TRINITY_DN13993_c0_g1_i1:135-761(-)